jgi:hypothetical protein
MTLQRLLGWPLWGMLEEYGRRLERLEAGLERITLMPKLAPPPVEERMACGHTAVSKATKRDGTTQCPACHQAEIVAEHEAARRAHEAREAARRAQAEADAARDANRRKPFLRPPPPKRMATTEPSGG